MTRIIDLKKTVYELVQDRVSGGSWLNGLCQHHNPMLKTAGRIMTLPKGAAMKGKDLEEIKAALTSKGFTVIS